MPVLSRTAFGTLHCIVLAACIASAAHGASRASAKETPPATKNIAAPLVTAGEFGKTYMLVSGGEKINFTLKSAQYTISRVNLGERYNELPTAKEKLLVLQFTLQNPNSENLDIAGQTLHFVAVDQNSVAHANANGVGNAVTHAAISGPLKPGQEVEAYAVIHVPAKNGVSSLLLDPTFTGLKALRFDLNGGVGKLAAPYADPSDPSGLSALEVVPGLLETPYSVGDYDLTLDKMEYTDLPLPSDLGAIAPDDGKHFAVFTLTAKCFLPEGGTLDVFTFNASLINDLSEPRDQARAPLLDAAQDTVLSPEVQFGREKHFRIYYPVPKSDILKNLTIQESALGRKILYDLTPLKQQQ